MKIHAICIAKNEADIISECLRAAREWADYIYVLDNGSDDGTWKIVCELSKEFNQIIPYQKKSCPFYNALRGETFNAFRSRSSIGDWWCRLDADEFYIDDPRVFLAKIPSKYTAVASASFQYYFTDKDLAIYKKDPGVYRDNVSVHTKCRYYLNNHGELRFVRHTKKFVWKPTEAWPDYVGRFYPVRIWLKHFQYRSPQQIQKRLDVRREPSIRKAGFKHELKRNWANYITQNETSESRSVDINMNLHWENRIVKADSLHYDEHDGRYVYSEDLLPPLRSGVFVTKARKLLNGVAKLRQILLNTSS